MTDQATPAATATTTAAPDAAAAAAAAASTQSQTSTAAQAGGDPWFTKPEYGLSEESKTFLSAKNYGSVDDQIKAHRQFETIARDRNALTGPTPGKELEWDGWEKTFGWTPDATKYGVDKPTLKEGVPYAPEFHDAFVKTLHASKVPPAMAKAIVSALGQHYETSHEAALRTAEAEDAAVRADLQKEWGANFAANEEMAKRAALFLGIGMDDMAELNDIIGSPRLVKAFQKIGALVGEDKLVTNANGGQGGFGGMSPAAAQVMQRQLEADPDFVKSLSDPRHPQHTINTDKRRQLFAIQTGQR